jgi:alpha-L-rhamnosidase
MKTIAASLLLTTLSVVCCLSSFAQDYSAGQRKSWLEKAEQNKPQLLETINKPRSVVSLIVDANAFQGWTIRDAGPIDSLYQSSFKSKSGVVIDFGIHQTGYYTFSLKPRRGVSDAPLRLKFTFGEVPSELATPFDPYTGSLSRAWLQDEIVTVMEAPAEITIPRRVSFRYVKIELLGSSPYFDFAISDMQCRALSSVAAPANDLAAGTDSLITAIDRIGQATLKECMQTVYEDGPKRDRRLWIGDLYLESLANNYSFKNHALTRRCFYLLAALSQPDGLLHSNVFETPQPHPQTGAPFLFDYSLLYNVALKEYLVATGDRETAIDLWPVAKRQTENVTKYLKADGLFDNEAAAKAGWWLFVDWKDGLDRQTPIQGIVIFSLKNTLELARALGKEREVTQIPALIKQMTQAAKKQLYDPKTGLFTSGSSKQISYASQAWMILSGVATKQEGQKALKTLVNTKDAVRPGAPYLTHYYIQAMIDCGLTVEAKLELSTYWGGMVKKGADTFWEVYDPSNELLSPYNFYPVNSYCHAWSCTPVYFIRKYPEIFQGPSIKAR